MTPPGLFCFLPMQKVFNLLGTVGFVVSTGTLAIGTAGYMQLPSLANKYISELKLELVQSMTEMMPVQIDKALPQAPTGIGPAVPIIP